MCGKGRKEWKKAGKAKFLFVPGCSCAQHCWLLHCAGAPLPARPRSRTGQRESTATQAEPINLEQALLKERGKPYDQSDYTKFLGGEGIINEYAEFDCNLDHGYSKTVNDLVVADGKLYQANFNSVLVNGKNIQEVGTLPGKNIRYWRLTHDGEMGEIYLNDGSGYKVSSPPFAALTDG